MADHHQNLDQLKADHTPRAIADRLEAATQHSYLRDFVFGAVDGTVTTFAVVAGVAGAQLSAGIVVVLGLANLIGDGFSMAVSNYLGTRAEEQLRERLRRMEADHIDRYPEGEREEIRQIFAAKGFTGEDLEHAVDRITADRKRWIDTMLIEELGMALDGPSALRAAWVTFAAFLAVGTLPLLTFIWQLATPEAWHLSNPFQISAVLTGLAFFGVGTLKGYVTTNQPWRAGFETLAMGGIAASLAYGVGALLHGLVLM